MLLAAARSRGNHGPLGIELTAFHHWKKSLRAIPSGSAAAARCSIASGKVDSWIGLRLRPDHRPAHSGPLSPRQTCASATPYSMRSCLGIRPRLALVNEQAYSGGLAAPLSRRRLRRDPDGLGQSRSRSIPNGRSGKPATALLQRAAVRRWPAPSALLWTSTVAFQKLQRYAHHGDIEQDVYLDYVRTPSW